MQLCFDILFCFLFRYFCTKGAVTSTPTDGITGGPCPEGHYCPEGTVQPVPCDPGTYVAITQAFQCELCVPGWYCVSGSLFLCPAGWCIQISLGQFSWNCEIWRSTNILFFVICISILLILLCLSLVCRVLLSWRNWIWFEKLSSRNLWSRSRLLVCVPVPAMRWRALLLFQKWHSCHWAMPGGILLFTWKHLATTSLTGYR